MFALATPAHFIVQTLLADEFSASVMTAIVAVAFAVLVTLMSGLPKTEELRRLSRRDLLLLSAAGLLGIFGTQYLVLSHRFTDAPPGAEVIFFTTAAWGAIAALAGYTTRHKPTSMQLIAAAIALVGAAAVLANWERPSSFSPFVRYPREDLAMLLAGVAWAAFGVIMSRLATRHRLRTLLPLAAAPSAIVSLLVALVVPGNVDALQRMASLWPLLLVLCVTFAAMAMSWAWLSALVGVTRTGSLLFLAPVSLTVLAVLERRAGATGPSPLLWDAVLWGSIVTLIGAIGVALLTRRWVRGPDVGHDAVSQRGGLPTRCFVIAALALGALTTLAGAIALGSGALGVRVVGTRAGGAVYEASWTVPGAETIGAWLVFLCGLGLLVAGLANARRSWRDVATVAVALGVLLVLVAVPALDDTPLRTWTRWIPAEVQQDYGTEYASLTFADEPRTALTVGASLGIAGAAVFLFVGLMGSAGTKKVRPSSSLTTDSQTSEPQHGLETAE